VLWVVSVQCPSIRNPPAKLEERRGCGGVRARSGETQHGLVATLCFRAFPAPACDVEVMAAVLVGWLSCHRMAGMLPG